MGRGVWGGVVTFLPCHVCNTPHVLQEKIAPLSGPLTRSHKKNHSSGAASPVQWMEAANTTVCRLSSWLKPWACSWALGLPGCPPPGVWGAGTPGSGMMGAAWPPGSRREACGHLELAVLLASGPLPPNMGRQNGGLMVGAGESEATYGFHATLELQLPGCSGPKAGSIEG